MSKDNLLERMKGKERAIANLSSPLVQAMEELGIREMIIRQENLNVSMELKASGLPESSAEDILKWLETKTVNVRTPLVYGSRNIFWSSPNEEDGETEPSTLRADCLAQMAAEKKEGK